MKYFGIPVNVISQELLKKSILDMSLKLLIENYRRNSQGTMSENAPLFNTWWLDDSGSIW